MKQRAYINGIGLYSVRSFYMPTSDEIRKEAIRLMMLEESRHGLPAIVPEEEELKEGGYWEQARIRLMSTRPAEAYGPTEAEIEGQQRKYLEDMAGPLGLKLVPEKMYREYEKKVDREWKAKQKAKKARFEAEKLRKAWLASMEEQKRLKTEKRSLAWQLRGLLPKAPKRKRPLQPKKAPKLPKPKPVKLPKLPKVQIPKVVAPKKKKKRQRLHTKRVGKTSRKLNGVKPSRNGVYRISVDEWKVR